jgi:hypothetical protein
MLGALVEGKIGRGDTTGLGLAGWFVLVGTTIGGPLKEGDGAAITGIKLGAFTGTSVGTTAELGAEGGQLHVVGGDTGVINGAWLGVLVDGAVGRGVMTRLGRGEGTLVGGLIGRRLGSGGVIGFVDGAFVEGAAVGVCVGSLNGSKLGG